jgi:rod shape-determining protein MreD
MSFYLSLPTLFLAAVLQASLVPQIRFGSAAPDLVFLVVISWALNAELDEGLTWAFVGGILNDLLSAAPTGASVLGLVLIVFAISGVNRQLQGAGCLLLLALVLGGSLIQQAAFLGVLALAGHRIVLPDNIFNVILPSMAYNLVLVLPVYFFVRRLQKRVYRYKLQQT